MRLILIASILLATILFSFKAAFAETELACWNMYSKKGGRPIMTAVIAKGEILEKIAFNFKDEYFENYIFDMTEDSGEQWQHKPAHKKSELLNPKEEQKPELIVSKRSPYKGNNEYVFNIGSYLFKSPYYNTDGTYFVRLILPTDLSQESLKNYRIRFPSERSNAVVVIPPAYDSDQGGDNYLRMFCISK